MRTSFHHQPEAQHPNFRYRKLNYPIFWGEADMARLPLAYRPVADDLFEDIAPRFL